MPRTLANMYFSLMPRTLAVSKYRFLSAKRRSERSCFASAPADGRLLVRASAALLRLI